MKHLLLSLASVALLSSPATAQLHNAVGKAPAGHPDAATMEIAGKYKKALSAASRAAGTVTVKPVIDENISIVIASAVVDGKIVSYGAQADYDTHEITLELPAGTYDMLGFGYDYDLTSTYLVYHEAVEIAEGATPAFNSSEATTRIDFKLLSPTGAELVMPSQDGSVAGNCCIGDALNMVSYNGVLVFYGDVTLFGDGQRCLMTNFTSSKF